MKLKASLTAPLFSLVLFALVFATRLIDTEKLGQGVNYCLSVIALQLIVFVIPAIFFIRLKGVGQSQKLRLGLFPPGEIGIVILTAVSVVTCSILIRCAQIYAGVEEINYSLYNLYFPQNQEGAASSLYTFITFALTPAICEEFVFRSVLLSEYNESGAGSFAAVASTSLLYAMLSFSAVQTPVYALCGIAFAFLTYVTHSAVASVIAHLLFNIYAVFGEKYIIEIIKKPENIVFFIFSVTTLFIVSLIFVFSEAERINKKYASGGFRTPDYAQKRIDAKKDSTADKVKNTVESLLSPTMLLCILMFAIITFGLK
ncbi:MAG: type II CAAX endopeptidase family protein [Firmicutes bacterium]|nr:type II CAAX endopeptidase family protein [Bacillota bacterium]